MLVPYLICKLPSGLELHELPRLGRHKPLHVPEVSFSESRGELQHRRICTSIPTPVPQSLCVQHHHHHSVRHPANSFFVARTPPFQQQCFITSGSSTSNVPASDPAIRSSVASRSFDVGSVVVFRLSCVAKEVVIHTKQFTRSRVQVDMLGSASLATFRLTCVAFT